MTILRRDPAAPHCHAVDRDNELIHIDCASHIYPDGSVGLHDMCFSVRKNEVVALCGPNGSGKSTLIEHLNGLLLPSKGSIWVNGRTVTDRERADLWKEVGIVFQHTDDQLFAPTVLDDVMFGPINLGVTPEAARTRAQEALSAVGAQDLVGKLPNYLSGGQKRLVAIAGILAMRPMVIAMDEPTSDLDPVHSARIESLIGELKERFGISVVIATHDLDLAARVADRICLVRNGSVYAEGPPHEIFYDAALISDAGLRLPVTVRTYIDYCAERGIQPADHPIRHDELIRVLNR